MLITEKQFVECIQLSHPHDHHRALMGSKLHCRLFSLQEVYVCAPRSMVMAVMLEQLLQPQGTKLTVCWAVQPADFSFACLVVLPCSDAGSLHV